MEQDNRSLSSLIGDLSGNVATLFRKEIELAKAEAGERATEASVALGGIAAGIVLALAALIVLLQALVIGLTEAGIPAAWSALIVGLAVAAVGYLLVHKGVAHLKSESFVPRRSVNALEKDARAVKEHVS